MFTIFTESYDMDHKSDEHLSTT